MILDLSNPNTTPTIWRRVAEGSRLAPWVKVPDDTVITEIPGRRGAVYINPPAEQPGGWSSDEIEWTGTVWQQTALAATRRQRPDNAKTGMLAIQNAVKQINSPATAASYLTANYDLTGVPAGAQQALRDIYYAYSMLVRRLYAAENDWFGASE